MIGEPEMSDVAGNEPPGELLSDADGGAAGDGGTRRARPWLWAAGGIAVASAVWAAALHVSGGTAPDLHGYHLAGNPCDGAALNALTTALSGNDFTASDATLSSGPALDTVSCVLNATEPPGHGWATDYTVTVSVELHKRTDPRAEFENPRHARVSNVPSRRTNASAILAVGAGGDSASADQVHPVSGVGDEAYFVEPLPSHQSLAVLSGGAVLTLQVNAYSRWNTPGTEPDGGGSPPQPAPDLTRFRPAMTTAMRHLMTSLAS
ncbi:hypothetical protein [Actinacidiphila acidipaludis]|uniref:Uncharacterized protein n=1 Tax=Actinacidiphila acidipaludis TaxID=2873382 RepID=A0ABS7QHL7_9ACTN|nr:hypothetical protein [Streptomyces acidipaludis]MBY8882671.1 hypothetical protein [Streptomyces acidipaludis]